MYGTYLRVLREEFFVSLDHSIVKSWNTVPFEHSTRFGTEEAARSAAMSVESPFPEYEINEVPVKQQPPGRVVPTSDFPTKENHVTSTPEKVRQDRTVKVLTLDGTLNAIPMSWEEYGGPDMVRYMARKAEVQALLLDMVERLDEIEMDARFCLEDEEDRGWFLESAQQVISLSDQLHDEADAVRNVMGF